MSSVVKSPRVSKGCVITLPSIPTVPEEYRGESYTVNLLLGDGDSNPKLRKSNDKSEVYRTWGLSLSPAHESGYQLCASASEGCRGACLFHQGRGRCDVTKVARIAKTIALMEEREWFILTLKREMDRIAWNAEQEGFTPAIRPNIVSDVLWEKVFPWMFKRYPAFQFYDYTKHLARMLKWCKGKLPSNYHLTFSRSETNESEALRVLKAGGNVTVVFRDTAFPVKWNGFPVVNGDESDLRFLDGSGVVVGLYAKGTARHDDSGFVVDTSSARVSLPVI